MSADKKQSMPPKKTKEEEEAEAALEAACAATSAAACELDASAKKLRRTVSDTKLQAVRLPTPSQVELEDHGTCPAKT